MDGRSSLEGTLENECMFSSVPVRIDSSQATKAKP